MRPTPLFPIRILVFVMAGNAVAFAQTQTTDSPETLLATDFSISLAKLKEDKSYTPLPLADANKHLNRARCLCGEPVEVRVALQTSGIEKLKDRKLEAVLLWGADCAEPQAECIQLSEGSLGAGTKGLERRMGVNELFAAAGASACEGFEGNRALWLVLREDGKRLDVLVSQSLRLDSKAPAAPTLKPAAVGDEALHLAWTPPASSQGVVAHQALCSPAPAKAFAPAFDACMAMAADDDGGTGVAPCSERLSAGITSHRLGGLSNHQTYAVALVAIDASGNVSAASDPVMGTPAQALGFAEIYESETGQAMGGCRTAGRSGKGGWPGFAVFVALLWLHRQGKRWWVKLAMAFTAVVLLGWPHPARAESWSLSSDITETTPQGGDSPQSFALSLAVGFYRPNVDSEFSSQGGMGPFEKTFSSDRRPLWQLRLERFVWRGFGTLALGIGAGHYNATGKAFTADGQGRTADDTYLRVVPLLGEAIYRLDTWMRHGVSLVPYLRSGLDHHLWFTDADKAGGTWGWHAAAGLAFDLGRLDPESAVQLDRETGVNHTLLFVEVNHADITNFGASNALRLSDTTLALGLSLIM